MDNNIYINHLAKKYFTSRYSHIKDYLRMITLRPYGAAKDVIGQAEIILESKFATVESLTRHLISLYPALASILNCSRIILDSRIAQSTDILSSDSDYSIEILPPFSGG